VSAIAEAYVELRPGVGGWSKYYERKPNEVGIWGTASGMIALDLGERLGVTLTGADQLADMHAAAARFLAAQQISTGRDRGGWSITQLKKPAFVDATALAMTALATASPPPVDDPLRAGVDWLCAKQLSDGGWSNLERDRDDRRDAKTCPTVYAMLALHQAVASGGLDEEREAKAHSCAGHATRALKAAIDAAPSDRRVAGWARSLAGRHPDPAYTAVAVSGLAAIGENRFLASYSMQLRGLFSSSRVVEKGGTADRAPWDAVRDIWTPPPPLIERFMIFFTTAWVAQALAALADDADGDDLDTALEWLSIADRGGKFYVYDNYPHNFMAMDALRACAAYVDLHEPVASYGAAELGSSPRSRALISYRRGDSDDVADWLARGLRSHGIEVWWDRWNLIAGDSLSGKIEEAFRSTDACVILLSPAYLEGTWSVKEMRTAVNAASRGAYHVIPLIVEPCDIPELLRELVYVEFPRDDIATRMARLEDVVNGIRRG
jgi:hypothetical protein